MLFSNGLLLTHFFCFTTSKYVCGCVTFAYALRQHQCFLLCFALNRINLFPVLYILFNKSFQKVFTLDSLSNIKGWCVWVCVWVSVGVCIVYNKVPHFIVEITVYYEIFGLDFSFTMHRWKGCVVLKVRWKSSRLPCIRVWGKRISVKLLLLVLGAREQMNIFHILVSIFVFFLFLFLKGRPKQN